jgi:signal transduction histidine kinase/predicted RNA-binding protein with RPS1 domain/ActR/RegA family two-component response regulator
MTLHEISIEQSHSHYTIRQTVLACVEQVFPFGAFVRLPDGTQGYVRKRELTLAGNQDPREVVSPGQEIKAVVVALPQAEQSLELSVRQAEPDPWETFGQSQVRDTVTATVKKLYNRGALVQVTPGVDGFIPLAELAPWPVEKPDDLLWVGDRVEAMITHLDRQARRMWLSIRQQVKHTARVREVLSFLSKKEDPEETLPQEEPVTLEKDQGIDPAIAQQVGRILVVDDHDKVREPLAAWLHRMGFATEQAKSPHQALDCCLENAYGLALIDLNLSGQDGLELVQALKDLNPDIPIAIMSTPEWIAQRLEALSTLRPVHIFAKPLDLDEIRELLVQLARGEIFPPTAFTKPEVQKSPAASSHMAKMMRSDLSLAKRFQAGLQELVQQGQADQGILFQLAPDSQQISIVAQAGNMALNQAAMYNLRQSPVKDVIYEQDEVFETDVSRHAQGQFSKLLALLPFESCLGVPIPAAGQVQHALFLFHREPEIFSRYRLRDARAMAVLFSAALESQALEKRIQSVSPFLLSGQLAAGFGHEVYNKMSGLELQICNLQSDCQTVQRDLTGCQPVDDGALDALLKATGRLLESALDLKGTLQLFRELVQAEQQDQVDVNAVTQRAIQLLRTTAGQHQVIIEEKLVPDLPPVRGSAVRLQQVFVNLMLNAIQQTALKMVKWPEGQGVLSIATTWEPAAECPVQVRFMDNGPGIHRHLWDKIFTLGFSTRQGGTGLGLFIAKSLIESLGGKVCVEQSMIPEGSIFRVELPAAKHCQRGASSDA